LNNLANLKNLATDHHRSRGLETREEKRREEKRREEKKNIRVHP